jgi:hypothetical protein
MATINIELTDIEMLILDHVMADDQKVAWLENWAKVQSEKVGANIKTLLIEHCNSNEIAIAVGESAQIQQAYDLGVISLASEYAAASEEDVH